MRGRVYLQECTCHAHEVEQEVHRCYHFARIVNPATEARKSLHRAEEEEGEHLGERAHVEDDVAQEATYPAHLLWGPFLPCQHCLWGGQQAHYGGCTASRTRGRARRLGVTVTPQRC